jgi:hypothetical protein
VGQNQPTTVYQDSHGFEEQLMMKALRSLAMLLLLAGAVPMAGCSNDVEESTAPEGAGLETTDPTKMQGAATLSPEGAEGTAPAGTAAPAGTGTP